MDGSNYFARAAGLLCACQLAEVVSLSDPLDLNRVQIRLLCYDGIDGQDVPIWARVVAPFAGSDRGCFLMPDVGDEVCVAFVQGDTRHPLVIGGLWSGKNSAPASIGNGNILKRIRSRNGIQITLEDQQGQETMKLETPGGQSITLKDGPGQITIEDANGNSIKLATAGITLTSGSVVKIEASKVDVSAGMVNVDTALAKFSGIVKCEVLQATTVISTTYTPGAGNIW